MNPRRWIGLALSAAWLAGVAGYEIAELRFSEREAGSVVTPLCQQVDDALRARCVGSLSHFYVRLSVHHAAEIVGIAALACLLGWLAGLFVIRRIAGTAHR